MPVAVASAGVDASASATAAAGAMTPALAAAAGKTTFVTGFIITGAGATGASVITVTITGVIGGTMSFKLAIVAGATLAQTPLAITFARPIPASATNTAITLNVPSFGAGNTDAAAVITGYQLTD